MLDFRAGFCVGVRASFLYGALARFSAQRLFVRHRYTRYENTRYQSRENTTTVVADFAQKAKSRGGTLVTRAYIKESTYSWNIQSVCQKKSRFA